MRVLVVGQGGREHALCWKLKQSPLVKEIYAAPGNAGIAQVADCVPIGVADIIELADFADKLKIDLTVVGPELPLTLGIVDEFQKRGLPIFGPTRLAAELEGSKVFSKEFMRKYAIPTAEAAACSSVDEAKAALKTFKFPAVIKVDGLASGKGVVIVNSQAEADDYLRLVFEEKRFGNAATRILIEEFLTGEEVSFMVISDGKKSVPLAPAKDYKKAFDGETGPNTGGMGAYSPPRGFPDDADDVVRERILAPVLRGLIAEGETYVGVLYCGLMWTDDGPYVIEFNVRFGDPETQVLMPRVTGDFAGLLASVANGAMDLSLATLSAHACAGVVLASVDYPRTSTPLGALDPDVAVPHGQAFWGNSAVSNGRVMASGGRVLTVTATGDDLAAARANAYAAVKAIAGKIGTTELTYRTDIGL